MEKKWLDPHRGSGTAGARKSLKILRSSEKKAKKAVRKKVRRREKKGE